MYLSSYISKSSLGKKAQQTTAVLTQMQIWRRPNALPHAA